MVTKWGTVFVSSGDKTQNPVLNKIISLCQKKNYPQLPSHASCWWQNSQIILEICDNLWKNVKFF